MLYLFIYHLYKKKIVHLPPINYILQKLEFSAINFYFILLFGHFCTIKSQRTLSRSSGYIRSNDYVVNNRAGEVIAPRTPTTNSHEPSCEELRAMWIFSKRQSRASEMTNDFPTYRDPFAFNAWETYNPTTRSFGGYIIFN